MIVPRNGIKCIATAALLAFVCHVAIGAGSDDVDVASAAHAITDDTVGNDTSTLPDFDGDGTVGFSDFVKFAAKYGLGQGDDGFDAQYDLNNDAEIGFADLLIFAENFGKEVPSPVVVIPDANLRAAIEDALGKATGETITQAEMATLRHFGGSEKGISDLAGLETAVNLEILVLFGHNIRDVSPLAGLNNLSRLMLRHNNITDVSPLSGLSNLTSLDLADNNIRDVSPLSGLDNLTSLDLGANNIMDVSPLSGLNNLTSLELWHNNITDVSPLSGLNNLTSLVLTSNNISNVSPLARLINLVTLDLWHNNITDVSPLSGLNNLTSLDLAENNISNVSSLSRLNNLASLRLNSNSIPNVSPLSRLNNLTSLDLWGNNITDVSPLSGLNNLASLRLTYNNITDVSPLSALNNLTELGLDDNNVSDVSPLSGLNNLTSLGLDDNNVSDVSPLSGLNNLTFLRLDDNNVLDVSPLSGLNNLTRLSLRNNRIADLSPLAANSGLAQGAEVDVRGNPLNAISYTIYVPALQRRGVDLHADPNPETIEEYDSPTLVAKHDDRIVVMGVPGRLRTDPIDFDALARAFFTHYEDAFDYLMVLSNLPEYGDSEHYTYAGIHLSVRNDVKGTGKSMYSKNRELGSAGRLNAILHFPYNTALPRGPFLHEILHSWANFTIPTAAGGHWGFSSANGQLGGFDRANLVDHGGGRYSAGDFGLVANGGNGVPYSPIELYFAGLIPPSEVPNLWVAEDGAGLKDGSGNWVYDAAGNQIFTASKVSTWSIERIVAEHGARVPNSLQSQRQFRAALILAVDPLHPPRQITLDHLSEAVQAFTHAGEDDSSLFNFWEATGGRATLTMDGLSAYRRSGVAGKRTVTYRVAEPEANQDGSVGCVHQMDDSAWGGQWMVALPEIGNR